MYIPLPPIGDVPSLTKIGNCSHVKTTLFCTTSMVKICDSRSRDCPTLGTDMYILRIRVCDALIFVLPTCVMLTGEVVQLLVASNSNTNSTVAIRQISAPSISWETISAPSRWMILVHDLAMVTLPTMP